MILKIPCSVEVKQNMNFSSNEEEDLLVKMKIVHEGTNVNMTSFSKSTIEDAIETLYDRPILAYLTYDENGNVEDFEDHKMALVSKVIDGKKTYTVKYLEQPIGVFSNKFDIGFELDEESGKEYLTATGTIWKRYCNDACTLLQESDKSVSMEILVEDSEKDKDSNVTNIKKFKFLGVTILGDDFLPGIEGAEVTIEFSSFNNKNKEKEEKDAMDKGQVNVPQEETVDYSLSLDLLMKQIYGQLRDRVIEKEYSWGEKYQVREYYYETIIPESNMIILEGSADGKYYGVGYSMDNDNLVIDFDNAKEYVYEWREKTGTEPVEFSLNEELKDITKEYHLEQYNKVVDDKISEISEDLKNANETVFNLNEELKGVKEDLETLKEEKATVEEELATYKQHEEEVKEEMRVKEIEETIAKFSFEEDEVKELKEKCIQKEFDVEVLSEKLYALYGKKVFEKGKTTKEPEEIEFSTTVVEERKPYNGFFEKY